MRRLMGMRLLGRSWLRLILVDWGGDERDVRKGFFGTRAPWYASFAVSSLLGIVSSWLSGQLQLGSDVIMDGKGACIFVIAR